MTTNNKDFPPTTLADVDAQIDALKKDDEAQRKSDINLIGGLLSMSKTKEDLLKMDFDEEDIDEAIRRQDPLYNANSNPDQGASEPAKPEEEELLTPLKLDDEPVVPTVEDKRTPEEKKVDEARNAYVKEYLRCKEIAKKKSSILDVFDGKKKRERKEQENLDQGYKDAKEAYDKARVEMGDSLFDKKKSELMAGGVYGPELDAKLKEYKATEILAKTILNEGLLLAKYKAEGTPINLSKFKKALNWYIKQPRWKKVALSTGIFTVAAATGVFGAAVGTGSLAGMGFMKFVKGMGFGAASAQAAHGIDAANAGRNKRFKEAQDLTKSELRDRFGEGKISQEEYEKSIGALQVEDQKRMRKQALVKLAVGVALGAGMGAAASHLGIGGAPNHAENGVGVKEIPDKNTSPEWFHKQPGVPQDSVINKPAVDTVATQPAIPNADTATNTTPDNNVTNPTDPTEPTQGTTPPPTPDANTPEVSNIVEAEVSKGHGAIKTLEEFQEKLKAQYPDPTKAPASVQHILNTKPDRLAIEYGMFKPGQDAESAIMKIGSEFKADAEGNITFEQEGKTTLLEKGDDADVTNVYGGRMIDGDNSGRPSAVSEPRTSGTSEFLKDNPQKAPVGAVDGTTLPKTGDGTSEFIKDNPQKDPAGLNPATEKVEGITTPKIEDIKSNLTSGRLDNISPTQGAFDNSYGTNTETISPTRGVYNVGEAQNSGPNFARVNSVRDVEGNGFTRENPMTDVARAENEMIQRQSLRVNENTPTSNNTGNAIENQAPKQVSINQDPRHADSLEQARERFGRSNIEIEKPEGDYTNGIKHEDWNKAADNMFKVKNVKFDSFESYEKEDELQRLLGSAKQEVKYVQSIDKNAEVVTMQYFREQPEWKTIDKIPAKYFFNNFEGASFTDGTPIPQADLDKLVDKGIIRENVNVTPGQSTTTSYSFKNQDELERLSKTYKEILSKEDIALGNDKPIGDENLEKYVARMTKRVYTADDGTMFAPKEKFVPTTTQTPTTSQGYETMRADRVTRSNSYSTGNNRVISPTRGAYQTESDYSLANRFVENIMRRRR